MNPETASKQSITIGRGKANHIVVPTLSITEVHARVVRHPSREGDTYWLEDNNSSNGTYVNDFRIVRRRLQPDDQVRIGNQVLTYRRLIKAFSRNPDDYTREFAELEGIWEDYIALKEQLENRNLADQVSDLTVGVPLIGLALGRLLGAERSARKKRELAELEAQMTQVYACPKCGTPFPLTRDSSFRMLLQRSVNQKQGHCLAGCGAIWTI
ncbi:FHA domain-containing protein [Fibrella forsythiae]|uniref:FHA domain-containing protein n=1 Tax=Fibrella forsythiae TaxID=2817061 RepID=A0ABS3JBM4_9BACT|nr:FHA domain-containing protein [Fibrella forsythiae]MBO0947396.1 FHA domain-containing protein [Fibrella forsythiae]